MPIKQKAIKNIRNGTVCEKCKHKEQFPNGFPCWRCIGIDLDNDLFVSEEFFVRLKTTNGDLVRAMTDEELSNWYFNVFFKSVPYCTKEECGQEDPCEKCLLEWLKQEVNNERSDQEHEDAEKL